MLFFPYFLYILFQWRMFILNMEKYLNDEAKICTTNLREPGGKWTYIALFYSEPITSHFTHLHKYSDSTFLLSHTPMDPSAVIWSLAFFPLMLQLEDWRSQPSSTRHFQLRLQTAPHTHFQTVFLLLDLHDVLEGEYC